MRSIFFTREYEYDDFEKKMFRAICVIALLASLYRLLDDVFIRNSVIDITLHSFAVLIFLTFLYLAYNGSRINILVGPFIVLVVILSVVLWFTLGGIQGSVPTSMIGLLVIITVLAPMRYRMMVVVGYTILEISLVLIQWYYPAFVVGRATAADVRVIPYNMIVISFGVALLISYLKSGYEKERLRIYEKNQLLSTKNEEIAAQNEELAQQHEELSVINETLENHVRNRTKDLKKMNEKLAQYAFINAHILRAPVSRVKGLIHLLRLEFPSEDKNSEVMERLINSCEELDVVLKNINKALDEETAIGRSKIEAQVKKADYKKIE